jgi:hypothetical protein
MLRLCVWAALLAAVATPHVANGAEGAPLAKPRFHDFMGLNGHTIQFRPQLYQPVAGMVRDYHPVEWDLGTNSDLAPPFPFARNGVDWNAIYGSWRRSGWHIDVCAMFETVPRGAWKNLAVDAAGYAENFARAFGPSGTNPLVDTVEIGNEPGKFSDADYRVVFENMARGFKVGDHGLRVATCALTTGKSHDYAKSVECVAGLESFYDVLNVHTYAQLEGWPTWKRSYPEDPRLKDYLGDVRRLCRWRDEHAPAKEVWITEFGYDASSQTPNPKSEFSKWVGVTEEQQAQWIVRSWLVFATLPVQRAYLYFFNDEDAPQVHGSSGLTRHFEPKPAFYAAAHLQRTLGEYQFARVFIERPGEALLYEFKHCMDAKRSIWVTWSPTGNDRTATVKLPPFQGSIDRAERMPVHGGEAPVVVVSPQAREVIISESPLYLFIVRH